MQNLPKFNSKTDKNNFVTNVRVRAAAKRDTLQILNLLYQLDRPKPKTKSEESEFERKIMQYLQEKDKKIVVATLGSKIVGLVSVIFVPKLNQTKLELYIPDLVVLDTHRQQGIGRTLIDYCIQLAKKKGCFRIRLESGNKRKVAHKFYSNLGFAQYAKTYKLDLGRM